MNCAEPIRTTGREPAKAVLLPGWASDHRLLDACRFGQGCASAQGFVPAGFLEGLETFARRRGRIHLVGWSLGGFAAVGFAARYGQLVESLTLIGVRRSYPAPLLDTLAGELREDKRGALERFYGRCFSPAQGFQFKAFRRGLMQTYLDGFTLEELIEGLEYLRGREIAPEAFPECPTVFVHGMRDRVAPISEARALARLIPGARLEAVRGAGHAVFPVGLVRGLVEDKADVQGRSG